MCLSSGVVHAALTDEPTAFQAGRAFYHGYQALSRGPNATANRLPVELSACARCHGASGQGSREGSLQVPPLTWAALMNARAAQPAYESAQAVLQAIQNGSGRLGNALHSAMPRYSLTESEQAALLNYLQKIGTVDDRPQGVTQDRVLLGAALALSGRTAAVGRGLLEGLVDTLELQALPPQATLRMPVLLQSKRSVHGRRVDLLVIDTGDSPLAATQQLLNHGIYALVAGAWSDQTARSVEAALSNAHVPHIATLVQRQDAVTRDEWSADLLPPLSVQSAALMHALSQCAADGKFRMHGQFAAAAASKDAESAEGIPASNMSGHSLACQGYSLADLPVVQPVIAQGVSQRVVLPGPAQLIAQDAGGSPSHGAPLWRTLGRAAGALSIELLARAGAHLSERSLLEALDSTGGFEVLPGLPVSFSARRRYGWDPAVIELPAPTNRAFAISH